MDAAIEITRAVNRLSERLTETERQRDQLSAELAELRRALSGRYHLGAIWGDGPRPSRVLLAENEDGDAPDIEIDATGLLDEALRRQARQWVQAAEHGEGPPLEALLALVPAGWDLVLEQTSAVQRIDAIWSDECGVEQGEGAGLTYAEALRAATSDAVTS